MTTKHRAPKQDPKLDPITEIQISFAVIFANQFLILRASGSEITVEELGDLVRESVRQGDESS